MIKSYSARLLSVYFIIALSWLYSFRCDAQEIENHTINLGADPVYKEDAHFKQGTNVNPQGVQLDLNNYYLRQGGKPILPVMGEFEYSRYPRTEWEHSLLQMKAAGIQIIGFYTFWNHHEEEEGKFRFDDNRDVRYFLQLCAKHHLLAMVRIGPWVHGETRNGGYPDWYVRKKLKSGTDRASVNGSIQPEVAGWYAELAKQFQGLYYKNGGPIIGIQLDNEVRSTSPKSAGYQYMAALKTLAVKVGIDVPYYVVTGWPGPIVPEDEVMPLWGGYADAPWTQNTKELAANKLYTFVNDRLDKNIGNDINKFSDETQTRPVYRHPFLTVEMGPGIQPTYLRRPVLNTPDIMGMLYTRLGVGANLLGYYIFHGVQHPLSWNQDYSTQESKSNIYPYANDYPAISYDFEAPITEWGYLRPYYHDLKLLHQFVNSYAKKLAPMSVTIPADNPTKADDPSALRYAVRSKGSAGFVFFNNYTRHYAMNSHPYVAFTIKTKTETIRIPEKGGLAIQDSSYGVFPFNDNAGGVLIKYATVHPAAVLGTSTFFYYAIDGVKPELKLDNTTIKSIHLNAGHIIKLGKFTFLTDLKPGKDCVAEITTTRNRQVKLVVLTKEEARYSYVFEVNGMPTILISKDQVFYDEVQNAFTIRAVDHPDFSFYTYPAVVTKNQSIQPAGLSGLFHQYRAVLQPEKDITIPYTGISDESRFKSYIAGTNATPLRPVYDVNYVDTLPAKTYQLTLPKQLPPHVYDLLLSLNYNGNTVALYANGKILADQYYLGGPMNLSLRRIAGKLASSQFIFQVTPLLKNAAIYFEPGTYLDFKNTNDDGLKSIKVQAIYELVF
jgi:hypothetical protein